MIAKFKIGDYVSTEAGIGEVSEIYGGRTECAYGVLVEGKGGMLFYEEELKLIQKPREYSMDIKIDIAQNVVIATLYEMTNDTKGVVAKGHGHLIHDGELGIAQAASYACMRLYKSMGGFEK